ncbi:MAG: DUF2089 domain-containing protein [Fimbriimonadaceae bacterium]
MAKSRLHQIPSRDPVTGGELHISELANDESGVTIRGKFEIPRYSKLDAEQQKFLETFLRCRGMLSGMEREMNMSYPTLRSRLDSLLAALELEPFKDEKREKVAEKKTKILDELERGEITADEAKVKLREARK